MQLTLTIERVGELVLPLAYHHHAQSMIYALLDRGGDLAARLHDFRGEGAARSFKIFTFGPLSGRYRVEKGHIVFDNRAQMEIRGIQPEFMQTLCAGSPVGTTVTLGETTALITGARLTVFAIRGQEIVLDTMSPICVRATLADKRTVYFSPFDEEFAGRVNANFAAKYRVCYGSEPVGGITLLPVRVTPAHKYVTRYKQTMITAWHGRYRLSGSEENLNFLYHTGLGEKNSQGFGMFRLAVDNKP